MSSEIATGVSRDETRQRVARDPRRALAVQLLGPLVIFGALVWAVAQPYRIVFFDRAGRSAYDYLFQPPLLVVLVGLVFMFFIAPGLVEDLEAEEPVGSQG